MTQSKIPLVTEITVTIQSIVSSIQLIEKDFHQKSV